MDWESTTELIIGMVLANKATPKFFNAANIHPAYSQAWKVLSEGGDYTDLMRVIGPMAVRSFKQAAEDYVEQVDWPKALKQSMLEHEMAESFSKLSKDLGRGRIDIYQASEKAAQLLQMKDIGDKYYTMDKIDPEYGTWVPTYYSPLDKFVGGIPKGGLTIVAAGTGTGKTTFAIELSVSAARAGKKTLWFTFEMLGGQLLGRMLDVWPDLTIKERSRITATHAMMDADEVYTDIIRLCDATDYHSIYIDFADFMVRGEMSEQAMAHIMNSCARAAKETAVPVVLIAQYNRASVGEIPKIHHLRWSSAAEQLASLILLLYNPGKTFVDTGATNTQLPLIEDRAYIIVGKSRYKVKAGGIGAVSVDWNNEGGSWGRKDYGWIPLS